MRKKDMRWRAECRLYDQEGGCGFGTEAAIEVEANVFARYEPAEPEVGVMGDNWDLKYEFKPVGIVPMDDNGDDQETVKYDTLKADDAERVKKFCLDRTADLQEQALEKGPSTHDYDHD